MISRVKIVATVGLAVFVAGWVALASWSLANARRVPQLVTHLRAVPIGEAKAQMAFQTFVLRNRGNSVAVPTAQEVALARASYRAEPLSVTALALAIAVGSKDNNPDFREQIEAVGALSRRNALVNALAVNAYARAGEVPGSFRWISRSAKVDPSVEERYASVLASATVQADATDELFSLLAERPAWATSYWRAVVRIPAALENAAIVRSKLVGHPSRETEFGREERVLLDALINNFQYDAAFRLVSAFPDYTPARKSKNLLQNPAFGRAPVYDPFDWTIDNDGEKSGAVDPRSGSMQVSALGGANGHFVRQLVGLKPGTYAAGWEVEYFLGSEAREGQPRLEFRIACADQRRSGEFVSVPLKSGRAGSRVKLTENCRWYWVGLALPGSSTDADPFDARIRGLALIRVQDESPAVASANGNAATDVQAAEEGDKATTSTP